MRIISVCLNPTIDITSDTDLVFPVSKVRTREQRISPGGGGVNVARVLSSFGVTCELVYFSGGATGRVLDSELQQLGINTRCFRNETPTRIAFTVRQTSNQQEYRFVPEGPLVSENAYEQLMKYLASVPLTEGDYMIASGSLPRGVPDDTYSRMNEYANRCGARFVLDSSGAGLENALSGEHPVFLIKPSHNELRRLAGKALDEQQTQQFAQHLVAENRAEHVAVSLGSHGAFLVSKGHTVRLPAYLVNVQSAVGAGDSFVGAMVYALINGHPLDEAFRYGLAGGAAAVMTAGDRLCQPADVKRLFRQKHHAAA